jgi:glycosyltransferase involved in cell wall biosynthesis
MISVLLVHAGTIPHYRLPIYNFLGKYLKKYNFELFVVSNGIQPGAPDIIEFKYTALKLSALTIAKHVKNNRIDIMIDYMELKHRYLFPTYLIVKGMMRKKIIYWGQGRDLLDAESKIKNLAYFMEQSFCDAIILYADFLKKFIAKYLQKKTFIANNTLYFDYEGLPEGVTSEQILSSYGIKTRKNIICMGRMQFRKQIGHLYQAFIRLNRSDVGLILVGPDTENVLDSINGHNIYKLGPIYGNKRFDLLVSSDIFCLPGAVGLSIIDAFYCGLPFITEDSYLSAEMMYLKDGVNGFIVPPNDISALTAKLQLLLDDDDLRHKCSAAAIQEATNNASIEKMCAGFRDALLYVMSEAK